MRAYLIRRVLLVIPTIFIVTILVFLSVRFIPGSVIEVMVARMGYEGGGAIDIAAAKKRLGLDVPVPVQYGRWIGKGANAKSGSKSLTLGQKKGLPTP